MLSPRKSMLRRYYVVTYRRIFSRLRGTICSAKTADRSVKTATCNCLNKWTTKIGTNEMVPCRKWIDVHNQYFSAGYFWTDVLISSIQSFLGMAISSARKNCETPWTKTSTLDRTFEADQKIGFHPFMRVWLTLIKLNAVQTSA
jgi:hypothetical protein